MTLKDGEVLRKDMKKVSESRREVRQPLKAAFYKRNVIDDHYNELTLALTKHCKVVFRAYNEGVAYHFVTDMPGQEPLPWKAKLSTSTSTRIIRFVFLM